MSYADNRKCTIRNGASKRCLVCNVLFFGFIKQKYCSRECYFTLLSSSNGEIPRNCKTCKSVFFRVGNLKGKSFCSNECRPHYVSRKSKRFCIECKSDMGVGSQVKKFCDDCNKNRIDFRNKQKNSNNRYTVIEIRKCRLCPISFEITRENMTKKLCSKNCENNWRKLNRGLFDSIRAKRLREFQESVFIGLSHIPEIKEMGTTGNKDQRRTAKRLIAKIFNETFIQKSE